MAYAVTNLLTLRSRIRERLLSTFWSDDELTAYIIEAIRVWNVLTSYFQEQTSAATITGSSNGNSIAALASDCIAPLRFVDQVTGTIWGTVGLEEISALQPSWLSETTGAPSKWIPVGLDRFFIHPIGTSNNVIIDYIATATVPASDSDYIQIGEEDMSAIIDYVTFIGHLKEGGAELQGAIPLFQNFLKQASKYNSKIAQSLLYANVMGMPESGQSDTRPSALDRQSRR